MPYSQIKLANQINYNCAGWKQTHVREPCHAQAAVHLQESTLIWDRHIHPGICHAPAAVHLQGAVLDLGHAQTHRFNLCPGMLKQRYMTGGCIDGRLTHRGTHTEP